MVLGILFCTHKAVFILVEFRGAFRFSSGGEESHVEISSLLAVVSLLALVSFQSPKGSLQQRHMPLVSLRSLSQHL